MRRSVLVATITILLLLPDGARAQEPAPLLGNFGGGSVHETASPLAVGNMVIGLRAGGGSRVRVSATIVGACASGSFTATAPVAADGTFSVAGAVRQATVRTSYELRGTLTATPAGTATARFTRDVRGRSRSCSAEDVHWEARRPLEGFGEPAAVSGGAGLFGTTAQRDKGVRRGIALRISPDGRSLTRAIYAVALRCTGDVRSVTFDLPRGDLPIGADGRVSDRESGTRRMKGTILSYVERFAATLGSTGAAGMFSVSITVRRRDSGRRITRCRSGSVRWSASV